MICGRIALVVIAVPSLALGAQPPGAASCLGCHPASAVDSPVPALSTRTAAEIAAAMTAYRAGTRQSTVMDRIAKGFSDEEIHAIAQWYGRADPKKP
jgi:cytochrome subunit of sulfide dehydrogenase